MTNEMTKQLTEALIRNSNFSQAGEVREGYYTAVKGLTQLVKALEEVEPITIRRVGDEALRDEVEAAQKALAAISKSLLGNVL